jgi:hypothetical protein
LADMRSIRTPPTLLRLLVRALAATLVAVGY